MKAHIFKLIIIFVININICIFSVLSLDNHSKSNGKLLEFLKISKIFITPRIIGGNKAVEGQFPWQVILKRHEFDKLWCGGSIISNNWILTAAHCVDGYNTISIAYGTIKLNKIKNIMKSSEIVIHPNFNSNNYNYDIALIKLPQSIVFNDKINEVTLVPRSQSTNSFAGELIYVTGFGYTSDDVPVFSNNLLYTNMEVITNDECRKFYGDVIITSTMCAKGPNNLNTNICGGDSGGAMVLEQNGNYIQVGINSFVADEECEEGVPSGFVRVGSFLDFISQQTGIIIKDNE